MDIQEQVQKFQDFLDTIYKKEILEIVKTGKKSLIIDFSELARFDSELSEQIFQNTEDTFKSIEIALSNFDIPEGLTVKSRLINLPKSQCVKIRDVRSEHLNKFLVLEGIVRQSSDVRPQVISARFECPACGAIITIPQLELKFKEPSRCSCGRKGRFRLYSKDLVDSQRLIVEESPESMEGGEQPKRISVFLREDLVEPKMEKRTTPGAKIRVYGLIKEVSIPSNQGGYLTRFDIMMEANNIEPIEETYEELVISKEEESKIKDLSKDEMIYEKLVGSMAPSIYGHEDIKGALVLQLFGGVRKERKDGGAVKGDIHILLVGDPGSAKTSLLMFMAKAAPKSRYVSGKGATSRGLTAVVVKDEFLKGWALEAGAIVLANGGILLLDELDKISDEDTSALHEALSSQTITIAKANIQATLKARTTLLAAANPKLGRFDPYQPIAAQIDMPPALINRFDLIFPVKDIPNKDKDTRIATHILEFQHSNPTAESSEISIEILKKYVAYAKQNISPRLTQQAIDEIRDFYVGLRNMPIVGEQAMRPIPISARQLESLVRLAEASARIRLSNKVTKEDSKRAINIMKNCLMQVGFDYETGQIDIDRISTGIPTSTRNKIVMIQEIIRDLESRGKKTIPIEDILSAAQEKNITEAQVEEIVERLKREGELFEPRRGFLSRI